MGVICKKVLKKVSELNVFHENLLLGTNTTMYLGPLINCGEINLYGRAKIAKTSQPICEPPFLGFLRIIDEVD